jgi:hypothetical protein
MSTDPLMSTDLFLTILGNPDPEEVAALLLALRRNQAESGDRAELSDRTESGDRVWRARRLAALRRNPPGANS